MWLLDGIASIKATQARVEDLTLDSRAVRGGSLFFALRGQKTHGLSFAAEAAARGASVVLWDDQDVDDEVPASAPILPPSVFGAAIPDLKNLVGRIADRFFNWPSSQLRVIGVTGTNGKTTCAYLLAQCLERLGSPAAYMGTVGWGRIGALKAPTHTTPDVITVHRVLAELRAMGVRDVAMEVSSHALDQDRVAAVRFHTAAFTNLSRDHLDYHGTMEAYGEAKALLLKAAELREMVVNIGDAFGRALAERPSGRARLSAVWVGPGTLGWAAERTLYADEVVVNLRGITLSLRGSLGSARLATRLLGRFNAENCLIVLGCLMALGVTLVDALSALSLSHAAPGRMELIESTESGRPLAVIDYAHTPDALAKALSALREHCSGSLWCVFGCGGDRDAGKRPLMGQVADELADHIVVTDDNPRSEDPGAIARAVAAGITGHAARIIQDRGEAIRVALCEAGAGDAVLIAGKGHESTQVYGSSQREFSDRREAQRYLGVAA
jgi:UDP-N-acetylmuramoyl-L-alanyl-D-glutamate--2,6-diaminopimelate ligase